jgi:hypothetical protein
MTQVLLSNGRVSYQMCSAECVKHRLAHKSRNTRGNMLNYGSQVTSSSLCIFLKLVILNRTRQRVDRDEKKRDIKFHIRNPEDSTKRTKNF